ncbi:glycosyltransferase [Halochromatium roseum]|uniref:glycosyltransferase n=1 Tax=Halochromatium roseum TaxID=391920 RepID=UPI001F5CAFA8|nr:glycosyltransferase [Halochromatium roseum]
MKKFQKKEYPVNPHLLYNGDFVASQVAQYKHAAESHFIHYFDYVNDLRYLDPHPLISLQFLKYLGYKPQDEDVFSFLYNNPAFQELISPFFISAYLDVGREAAGIDRVISYLHSGAVNNFPANFRAAGLIPGHQQLSGASLSVFFNSRQYVNTTEFSAPDKPLVSVVVPLYNTGNRYLNELIGSVCSQSYRNWELILYDDRSPNDEHCQIARQYSEKDNRIFFFRAKANLGISRATNAAVTRCHGKYLLFLDHDDFLHPDCLKSLVEVAQNESARAVYGDQALVDDQGRLLREHVKSSWDPVLGLQVMYIGHPLMVERKLFVEVGRFDQKYNRIQDYEFFLRVAQSGAKIANVSKVLYYWRAAPTSFASSSVAKGKIEHLQQSASEAFLSHLGWTGVIMRERNGFSHRMEIAITGDATDIDAFIKNALPRVVPRSPQHLEFKQALANQEFEDGQCYYLDDWIFFSKSKEVGLRSLVNGYFMFKGWDRAVIISLAALKDDRSIIAHGYSINGKVIAPNLEGRRAGIDDGSGETIAHKSVSIANPGDFAIRLSALGVLSQDVQLMTSLFGRVARMSLNASAAGYSVISFLPQDLQMQASDIKPIKMSAIDERLLSSDINATSID